MAKKGVKVWGLIAVLMVVGSAFSGVVSAEDMSEDLTKSVADAEIQALVDNVSSDELAKSTALDDDPFHQLPATSGKISYFASDDGHPGECDPAAWGELLGERCGTDEATKYWYCAMRWPYVDAPTEAEKYEAKEWWHNKKILVTNPDNGKQVVLAAKDWGPAEWTGRVIDVSKTALDALGAVTDDIVNIEFADQSAPLGVVSSSSSYDRQAAYNYAQKYWDKACSDGYFWHKSDSYIYLGPGTPLEPYNYKKSGYDCAHFVSCCIGKEKNESGGGLAVPIEYPTGPYGIPSSRRLCSWLIDSGTAVEVSSIGQLEKGDVIFYDLWGDYNVDHSAFYLGNGKIATHSWSYWDVSWDIYKGYDKFNPKFIHIKVDLPDLTPYKPSDWSDKIVVSKRTGTHTDDTDLTEADTLYVDWAVANQGTGDFVGTVYYYLYVDGAYEIGWYSVDIPHAGYYVSVEDYSIGKLSAGTHTIKIVADPTGVIQESREDNNEYSKTITVAGTAYPKPTISASDYKIEISVGETDWVKFTVKNTGTEHTSEWGIQVKVGDGLELVQDPSYPWSTAEPICGGRAREWYRFTTLNPGESASIQVGIKGKMVSSYESVWYTAWMRDPDGKPETWQYSHPVTLLPCEREYEEYGVKVVDPITSIDVKPDSWTMDVGEEKQFSATATYKSGNTEDVTAKATWSSSDTSVLQHQGSGKFKALKKGSATVTAVYEGKSDNSDVIVSPNVRSYTFQTTDDAMKITIDGTPHDSPYTVEWKDGTEHTIIVPSEQAIIQDKSKYVFTYWSGRSGSTSTTIEITASEDAAGTYNANYKIQYYLTVNTDPSGITSISGSGWYDKGLTARTGEAPDKVDSYKFLTWKVDGNPVSGNPISVKMDDAHTATACYVTGEYGVDLSCSDPEKTIPSKGYALYDITVKNTGSMSDTINLELPPTCLCGWVYSLDRYSVELLPGESTKVVLNVSDVMGHPEGSYWEVKVTGTSQGDSTKSDFVITNTTIKAFDWNPWDDPDSDGGEKVTTAELQEAIHCWLNDEPAPKTGAEISTERLQEVIHQWLIG